MRTVKFLAGLVGGIVVLIAAGLLVVWVLVNPNNYKGRIAAAVQESTGRELILAGDIKLSVFPAIALELGPASLGNPPGFGQGPNPPGLSEEPFLKFKHAAVRISVWRLLHEQLDVQGVEIDGLDLRLRKDARGRGNWQDFGQTRGASADEGAKARRSLPELPRIQVTHGRVSYPGMVVEKLDFETGAASGRGTPVRIGFDFDREVPGETLTLSAQFTVIEEQEKQLRLEGITLSGLVARLGSFSPTQWDLSAPTLEVDFAAQTLALPAFGLSYAGARVSGQLNATKILDELSATGSVALAPLSLRAFAPRLGMVLPHTRDSQALEQFSASGDVSYGAHGVTFDRMLVQLDDTHLKGSASLAGEPRALRFTLTVDQIDLDRYLSADKGASTPKTPAAPAAPAGEPTSRAKLPDASGTLSLSAVHLAPLDFSNVRLTLASKDNVVHLYPSLAQIDGGNYSGNIVLDNRGATPTLSLDEHLSGVDMTRLLAATPYKGRLSGRGNVNVKATARGSTLDTVMPTLNGHFDANLAGGALEGIDLGYELAAAQALIKHEPVPPRSGAHAPFDASKMSAEIPSGVGAARTPFDAFKMSAEIASGVARTTDLIIASPVLRVSGQGSANLTTKAIDFQLLASVSKTTGAALADIPLKVTGTYVDPTIRPDVEELAKGELKQKLKDVLKKNGLEGLFGK